MKLVHIQQALFAAYDIRNAMTTDDMYRPTEGESIGECLAEIINTLENIEAEIEKETEEYCELFDTNHGELSNPSTPQD
jgi:nitrate reductase assembly molybdenum cofactor insertion protein NarJ